MADEGHPVGANGDNDGEDKGLTEEELRRFAEEVRSGREVDEEFVRRIEATARKLREASDKSPSLVPPEDLQETLWLLGWLMYEAAWQLTRRVKAGWGIAAGAKGAASEAAHDLIMRLTTAYITMAWPHWAPRGLAVLRSAALSFSKQDTRAGYVQAWERHEEAQRRFVEYWESTQNAPERLRVGLLEAHLQLRLAETGTACRVAERTLAQWDDDPQIGPDEFDSRASLQAMFDILYTGSRSGTEALQIARLIRDEYELVERVDVARMALLTALRNPAIMTARAYLLMLPLTIALEREVTLPPQDYESWEAARSGMLDAFEAAYRDLEAEVIRRDGQPVPLSDDHLRSLVQLRLNLALIRPGTELETRLEDAALARTTLDDAAAEKLAQWLIDNAPPDGRNDANVIGAVVLVDYIALVEKLRERSGSPRGGYLSWRRRWLQLDRYIEDDSERRGIVEAALDQAEARLRNEDNEDREAT